VVSSKLGGKGGKAAVRDAEIGPDQGYLLPGNIKDRQERGGMGSLEVVGRIRRRGCGPTTAGGRGASARRQ